MKDNCNLFILFRSDNGKLYTNNDLVFI